MTTPPFDGDAGQDQNGNNPYGQPPHEGHPAHPQPPYSSQQPYGSGPAQPQYAAGQYGTAPLSPQDERTWAAASHWGPLLVGLVTCGSLFWAVPLLIMLTQGKRSAWVRANAVESLNFQISVLIYSAVSALLIFVLVGLLTGAAVLICWIVFSIIATGKANDAVAYRYPLTIRLVS